MQIQEPQSAVPLWTMVAVTGILAFYSMLITAAFVNYWVRNYCFPLLYVLFVLVHFSGYACCAYHKLTDTPHLRITVLLHPRYMCTPMLHPKRAETLDAVQVSSQASAVEC